MIKHIRVDAVRNITGLSRTTIWRYVKEGSFPAPIELGPNSIAWLEDEVRAWTSNRPRRTYRSNGRQAAQIGRYERGPLYGVLDADFDDLH